MGRGERLGDRFRGKHAIVTGGSGGIGLAIARRLVELGAGVTLVARDPAKLERAAAELGGAAGTLPLDLTDRGAVERALPGERPVDLLVNAAGVSTVGEFMELEPDGLRREMDVNYFGVVWPTRAALPGFLERGSGHVVIVGSTASLIGIHGYGAYTPPKFALHGLAEVLRAELAPRGIGVTMVMPTSTRTPMFEREVEEAPPETRALITGVRVLEPREVAEATLDGVARGRFEVIPGRDHALSARAYRAVPSIGRRIVARDARKGGRAG